MVRKFIESYGIAIVCLVAAIIYVSVAEAAKPDNPGGGGKPPPAPLSCTITSEPATATIGAPVTFTAATDGSKGKITYAWNFSDGAGSPSSSSTNPTDVTYSSATGTYDVSLTVTDKKGNAICLTTVIVNANGGGNGGDGVSINSTSQDGTPETALPEEPAPGGSGSGDGNHVVMAINDLGMHCGDYDTRISSILPPFQVLLGQVLQRGSTPTLNPAGVSLWYSAASNPADPAAGPGPFPGRKSDGSTYKTNFWDAVANGSYDAFYPGGLGITPLATGGFPVTTDVGLPVPNVEELYIGPDGIVKNGDEGLTAVQHAMPGINGPYLLNEPQLVKEHYGDKPFFIDFPFGYVAADVNWFEGAGPPYAAYDDFGRENAYPLVRVQAKQGATTVATVDTVLPISGEASCKNCHSSPLDDPYVEPRTNQPSITLTSASLPVATHFDDPDVADLPIDVSVEYATDINLLRLHDLKHGANYVNTACDGNPVGENCVTNVDTSDPCIIPDTDPANPNQENGSASCLTNQALREVNPKPVVCQVCHYTPALDLAQVGPKAGPPGTEANGRNQLAHSSNSNVMHSHHGSLMEGGSLLFPTMPAPIQSDTGAITNQGARLQVLEETCYQCHPGTNVQCLRGAMFNGEMLCNDCHGDMQQVGNDFSKNVTPENAGAFELASDFYSNPDTLRTPWANEPGCGSCHTGDVLNNLSGVVDSIVNKKDMMGKVDLLRLRQAFENGDAKATPIVPVNKRFAEPAVPVSFANADGTTFDNPGAGNPQLYRVSTGHGGVMCENCHGATHAEWPNANPNANDNVTANQLQGHTGTITECSTCHSTDFNIDDFKGSLDDNDWMKGPHGMHSNDSMWQNKHKEVFEDGASPDGICAACHGTNGEGTVLSRTATDRFYQCKNEDGTLCAGENDTAEFLEGTPVGCFECHSNELPK